MTRVKIGRICIVLLLPVVVALSCVRAFAIYRQDCRDCQLIAAASDQDLERVRRLLREGASPTALCQNTTGLPWWRILITSLRGIKAPPRRGNNALHEALRARLLAGEDDTSFDNAPLVSTLLDAGADPKSSDMEGNSPLIDALSHHNSIAVPPLLINKGANVMAKNSTGETALLLASAQPDVPVSTVSLLLTHGARPNETDQSGRTALYRAVHSNRDAVVRLLVAHGADVNATDSNGETILAGLRPADIYDPGPSQAIIRFLVRSGGRGYDAHR